MVFYIPRWFTCAQTVTHPSLHNMVESESRIKQKNPRYGVEHIDFRRCGNRNEDGFVVAFAAVWFQSFTEKNIAVMLQ